MHPIYQEETRLDGNGNPTATKKESPTILIVADDVLFQIPIRLALQNKGFMVRLAETGAQAREYCQKHPGEIDLVLMETQLFDISGAHLLDLLKEIDPQIRCCFIKGEKEKQTNRELFRRGALEIFERPFLLTELTEQLLGFVRCPVS